MDLHRLAPPFESAASILPCLPDAEPPPLGSVLLLRIRGTDAEWPDVAARVPQVRRRFPAQPVVLWAPAAEPGDILALVHHATVIGVSAVVAGPVVDTALLRRQLTEPLGLVDNVLRWAIDTGLLASTRAATDVRVILELAAQRRTLGATVQLTEVGDRTWRNRFQRMQLPAPRAWLNMARGLPLALYLQRTHTLSIETAAGRLGYADSTVLSHQLHRIFAYRPGQIRRLLGFEPLLVGWFRAATELAARRRKPPA